MSVRGKFVVTEVTNYANFSSYTKVKLEARYDSSLPEDRRYAEATPSATIEMGITVPAVIEFFKPGRVIYVDFEAAPEGTSPNHT